MPRSPALSLIARLTGRHRPRRRRAQEPADLGTAFGMETCLLSRLTEPPPSAQGAAPATPSRWYAPWPQRWLARSRRR